MFSGPVSSDVEGNVIHSFRATTGNALSPMLFNLDLGTIMVWCPVVEPSSGGGAGD